MNFWKKLFSKESASDNAVAESSSSNSLKLKEADNLGTRLETQSRGEAYFVTLFQKDPEPIIFYFFDNKETATQALSEVSCIALADDSRKLICTDILTFGVFPAVDNDDSPTWGALLAGKNLTEDLWQETQECFEIHGGRMRREDYPLESTASMPKKGEENKNDKVTFCHDINLADTGGTGTKKIYEAPNKTVALDFLKSKNISESFYYIEIETPDGWVGKDKDGVYEF